MDALTTIAVEIQVTFTAVLVIALIVILQILDLRRANRNHKLKMLELSDSLQSGEYSSSLGSKEFRLISALSLFLQFVFGIVVLAIFSCWALYLVKAGYRVSAVFSGLTAFVGILMPFIAWTTNSRKNKEMAELIKDLERRPKITTKSETKQVVEAPPVVQIPEVGVAEVKKFGAEPIVSEKPITSEAPAVPEAAPVAKVQPAGEVVDISERIPEDSMLRRHYLTHIESKKQAYAPMRPTDSMLRRHYDSLMASLQQPASKPEPAPSPQGEPLIEISALEGLECNREKMPQDSMLKRHFLSVLRGRLEAGLPPSPTDSMLKRHFEGWKNQLIDRELNKCVESMES